MIVVIDFGSQTAHLIGRRLRDFGVEVRILSPEDSLSQIKRFKPRGIILSGGPADVFLPGAPTIEKEVFSLGIPILGICYGMQLMAHLLGGKVRPGERKEFGPTILDMNGSSPLLSGIDDNQYTVYMSHGNEILSPPPGFSVPASTKNTPIAMMQNESQKLFGLLFHPEVEHTRNGILILKNFVRDVIGLPVGSRLVDSQVLVQNAKRMLAHGTAIAAVSGGVDSSVASAIVAKAIGDRLIPIYIDNGLMRPGTRERIGTMFTKELGIPVQVVDAKQRFLDALSGVTDPEEKRRIIGHLYITCFEEYAQGIPEATYLVQGTIYSDVIESKGSQYADKIKSHHNVGGLPDTMRLKLYEPLRELYKDEVKAVGKQLGLSPDILTQQPFPGPGQAIRIIGEVTPDRLERLQKADQIVLEEMKSSGWYDRVFQSFPVLTNTKSTAVKGDGRFYGEVVALRVYGSSDIMTAAWSRLPYDLLQTISSRIVNEVPMVSRVVYDITTKPPATMEWE